MNTSFHSKHALSKLFVFTALKGWGQVGKTLRSHNHTPHIPVDLYLKSFKWERIPLLLLTIEEEEGVFLCLFVLHYKEFQCKKRSTDNNKTNICVSTIDVAPASPS